MTKIKIFSSPLPAMFATDSTMLFLGILSGSLAARLLLPEGRGAVTGVLLWPQMLAGIGLLSLDEAVTYRIGLNPEKGTRIAASAFWLALILAGGTMAVGYQLMPVLLGEAHAHLRSLASWYLLYTPFHCIALVLLAMDQGRLQFGRFNGFRLLGPLLYLAGIAGLWATDHVTVGWFVAVNAITVLCVGLLRLSFRTGEILRRPSWEETRALLRVSLRFHPANLLLLLAAQVDVLVVLSLWDDKILGLYVIAVTIASSGLNIASGAYEKVLFPRVVQVRDRASQLALLARGVRQATLLLVAISLPLALLMPWVVPALFGEPFREAVAPALILLLAYIFIGLKNLIIQSLRGLGEASPAYVAVAVSVGVFLAVAWPLGSHLGLWGIGLAMGIANLGAVVYLAFLLHRRFRINLSELWGLEPGTVGEIWQATAPLNPFIAKTIP